jgi:hypothetical protein
MRPFGEADASPAEAVRPPFQATRPVLEAKRPFFTGVRGVARVSRLPKRARRAARLPLETGREGFTVERDTIGVGASPRRGPGQIFRVAGLRFWARALVNASGERSANSVYPDAKTVSAYRKRPDGTRRWAHPSLAHGSNARTAWAPGAFSCRKLTDGSFRDRERCRNNLPPEDSGFGLCRKDLSPEDPSELWSDRTSVEAAQTEVWLVAFEPLAAPPRLGVQRSSGHAA